MGIRASRFTFAAKRPQSEILVLHVLPPSAIRLICAPSHRLRWPGEGLHGRRSHVGRRRGLAGGAPEELGPELCAFSASLCITCDDVLIFDIHIEPLCRNSQAIPRAAAKPADVLDLLGAASSLAAGPQFRMTGVNVSPARTDVSPARPEGVTILPRSRPSLPRCVPHTTPYGRHLCARGALFVSDAPHRRSNPAHLLPVVPRATPLLLTRLPSAALFSLPAQAELSSFPCTNGSKSQALCTCSPPA